MKRAILIKSCQKFKARRDACETWLLPLSAANISVKFILGGLSDVYHGAFTLGLCGGDGYLDNADKLRIALQHSLAIGDSTHVFICDDDTFIHPARWLAHEPQGDLECRVFRPRTEGEKKLNNGRPWVHGGPGWWMSRRMCELYVAECNERTSSDDRVVAEIAQRHGIEMVDRPDLYGGDRYSGHDPPERVSADNKLITCHHVQPAEMVKLWEGTRHV